MTDHCAGKMTIVVSTLAGMAGEEQRKLLVCVDYEGAWGMPSASSYDPERATQSILERLARHRARAVFFTVGALAVKHPGLVGLLAEQNHEIALHGWQHENLAGAGLDELGAMETGLREAEDVIESAN